MMILQKNEEGTRSRQIDLLCKQHNTSRTPIASLFYNFTIPKGTIKNILNGNVRLLIDEYLYYIEICTYTSHVRAQKEAMPPIVMKASLLFHIRIIILFR